MRSVKCQVKVSKMKLQVGEFRIVVRIKALLTFFETGLKVLLLLKKSTQVVGFLLTMLVLDKQ